VDGDQRQPDGPLDRRAALRHAENAQEEQEGADDFTDEGRGELWQPEIWPMS
jgi:hypothetical protein